MLTNYTELINKYQMKVRGVIHLGASTGQEVQKYLENGTENIILVEAIPDIYDQLKINTLGKGCICINECLSDNDGQEVDFNIANNGGQSSSFLEFDQHSQEHPTVIFTDKLRLKTKRFDTIVSERGIDINNFNYISLDLQGVELLALKGMGKLLSKMDYIYCEVSDRPMYKDQALISDIDSYLSSFGFDRKETWMTSHGWGDALYIKNPEFKAIMDFTDHFPEPFMQQGILEVPSQFRPHHPFDYPKGNFLIFEEWFYQNVNAQEVLGRVYLPVFWTSYYCRNGYGAAGMPELQRFIDSLDKNLKYFTIVQYDDGILTDISGLDIKVFAMSGKRRDYPLPLIAMQHPEPWTDQKHILCNFIGRLTHPCREAIVNYYGNHANWYVKTSNHSELEYRSIMAKSVFTLCPRGYGQTSFRLMECLEHGSIPVYISDDPIIPHNMEFNSYGILIHSSMLEKRIWFIEEILNSIMPDKILELQENGRRVFEKYYTYEGNKKLILENLK